MASNPTQELLKISSTKFSCPSTTNIVKFWFEWKIKDFSKLTDKTITSPAFLPDPDSSYKWCLQLEPNDSNFVIISPELLSNVEESVWVKLETTVKVTNECLGFDKKMDCWSPSFKIFSKSSQIKECCFIERDQVLKWLPIDKLILNCVLTIKKDTVLPLSQISAMSLPVPENDLGAIGNLYKSQKLCDIKIYAADGEKEFKAHRAILAASSPVFEAMFDHDTKERYGGILEMKDIQPDVLDDLLHFIYTGSEPPNLKKKAKDLLVASDKYMLSRLKSMCENQLYRDLEVRNAADTLILADMHSAPILKTMVAEFILIYLGEVLETDGWKKLKSSHTSLMEDVLKVISTKKLDLSSAKTSDDKQLSE